MRLHLGIHFRFKQKCHEKGLIKHKQITVETVKSIVNDIVSEIQHDNIQSLDSVANRITLP